MTGPEFMAVGFTCVGDQFQVVATLCMYQAGQIAGQAPTKLQRSSNLNYLASMPGKVAKQTFRFQFHDLCVSKLLSDQILSHKKYKTKPIPKKTVLGTWRHQNENDLPQDWTHLTGVLVHQENTNMLPS